MGEKKISRFDLTSIIKQKRINRRLHRKLSSKCRYCSGYEEKIHRREVGPLYHEIREYDKHELINCISERLGGTPDTLLQAEELLESLKYSITEYVLKHEFNEESGLSVHMAMWLEKRKEPRLFEPLEDVIQKYLKPQIHS